MRRYLLVISLILIIGLAMTISSAAATSSEFSDIQTTIRYQPAVTNNPALEPGNYCISCHLADDPRLTTVTQWKGGIARELNSICPAATQIHQELYYTERMLLMIDRAQSSVSALSDKNQSRLVNYTQRYSRLLDNSVTSLDAFVGEAQATRYQLNKVYTTLNAMADTNKLRIVVMVAALVTLVVLGSLGWGLYNTRHIRSGLVSKKKAWFWRIAFLVVVLAIFILPIFRVPPVTVVMSTEAQQAAQTTLDTAQRAADAADRAQARAWMLARIGTIWQPMDPVQAQAVVDEALSALETARQNNQALWGQSFVVQEVTVGTRIDMESAGLIADQLNASRSRSWALPLVADATSTIDPKNAAAILQAEQNTIQSQADLYRDLQIRSLVLAWVDVNPSQAAPLANKIIDPMLRAWTFRELAVQLGDVSLFDRALDAACAIGDPIQRARTLAEIAAASGQLNLFDEALGVLDGLTGDARAYALSDLAALAGNPAWVSQIDPAYPDAIASALLRIGDYQAAWEAAGQITDPYEQARAQAAVASAWGNADAALQLSVPLYRDIALRDVILNTGNVSLVDSISMAYYKVQALTGLGDLEAAAALAGNLGDAYPLVNLAVALSKTNQQGALEVVDLMSRETDKATALKAIAIASQDASLYDQARGMALASRVSGDPLAPVQALLDLAQALWPVDQTYAKSVLQQAYEAAQRISVK